MTIAKTENLGRAEGQLNVQNRRGLWSVRRHSVV